MRRRWQKLTTERLLDVRMCDLGLKLEGTWVEDCIDKVMDELRAAGLRRFRPHFWFADEWCSPDGIPGVGLPFYLGHSRLIKLERKMMFEVEGGTRAECMRLLRHEVGHALQHAYNLQRRKKWQRTFGRASAKYPEHYRPNPRSRKFVQHLGGWYAQSHPVEDFAETFAVWLTPRLKWRVRYATWPALGKLDYITELVEDLKDRPHDVRTRAKPFALSELKHTLGRHYELRRELYSPASNDQYDRDLRKIFSDLPRHQDDETAASFLRRYRREIREQVALFTGEYQFALDQLLRDIIARCKELKLRVSKGERQTKLECAIMLTAHTLHIVNHRGEWHAL